MTYIRTKGECCHCIGVAEWQVASSAGQAYSAEQGIGE